MKFIAENFSSSRLPSFCASFPFFFFFFLRWFTIMQVSLSADQTRCKWYFRSQTNQREMTECSLIKGKKSSTLCTFYVQKSNGSWKWNWGFWNSRCGVEWSQNRSHHRAINCLFEKPSVSFRYAYPFCVNCIGTSMLCDDERRRSPAMSAKRAKSVSRSWSAKRGERRDSDKRTSSNFLTNSNGACKEKEKTVEISEKFIFVN